ncbi:MAG: MBL fold metallo-hydrolase [Gaiellaceae bacterium]
MEQLRPGLWHWQAMHPEWTPDDYWPQQVSSYAIDDGTHLLLFDPLAVPAELEQLAAERKPVVVLTSPWHERDTQKLVDSLGVTVYAPPPDTPEDLMEKFGITREQAGDGSPDLTWLRDNDSIDNQWYSPSDRPFGLEVFAGRCDNDVILWDDAQRVVIAGDSLADFGEGLQIVPGWLPKGVTREQVVERLRSLLDKPIELVLAAHGGPQDPAVLERALA